MRIITLLFIGLISWAGCSDDTSTPDTGMPDSAVDSMVPDTSIDSATDTGGGSDGAVPTNPPEAPVPPMLTSCSPGWREVEVGGVTVCDPWPEGGPPDCGPGEAAFVGGGCVSVGTCPTGDWPEGLPDDSEVVFVQAGAGGGGSGTRSSPFNTIEAGVAAATMDQTVAIAKGTYAETATLGPARGVSLVGACAGETMIDSSAPLAVQMGETTSTISGLSMTSTGTGLITPARSSVTIENVIVEDVPTNGIFVGGGTGSMNTVVVRRVGGDHGILITSSTGVALSSVVVRDVSGTGIRFQEAGSTTLNRVAVSNTTGEGIYASGQSLSGALVGITSTGGAGIEAVGATADIDLADPVVRDADRGIHVRMGATAAITRGWLVDNRLTGMSALNGDALALTNSVVSSTRAAVQGAGVEVGGGSSVTLTNVALVDNGRAGLLVHGAGSTAAFTDLIVDYGMSAIGRGLDAESGGTIAGDRIAIRGSATAIYVHGAASAISANHLLVDRTRNQACAPIPCPGVGGIGIVSAESGAVSVDRVAVLSSAAAGVQVALGGGMDLTDGEILANPIGANVRDPAFDTARIQTSVEYRDNGVDLDTRDITTPDPLVP